MASKDAIQLYFRDIGEIPLLTLEEEKRLVKSLKGRKAKESKRKLIRSNLRLVVAIAKRYANLGVPFLDLIEEGNLGLMRAIDKYDPKKGARLSTYASWWIKQSIIRCIPSQGKTIRLPVYLMERMVTIGKAKQALKHKFGRPPKLKEIVQKTKIPIKKVKDAEMMSQTFSSLQTAIDIEGAAELIDIIEDIDSLPASYKVSAQMLCQDIIDLLETLSEREKDIITMRFGLKGEQSKTLKEIGKKYKLTRERVRQIESEAIKKMKKFLKQQKRDFYSYWSEK